MNFNKIAIATAAVALMIPSVGQAQDKKFMRSSIYTILVNSDDQNTRLDEEAKTADSKNYEQTLSESGLSSLGAIPKTVFPSIAIPEQFNDHNLGWRVINFDSIAPTISDAEAKAARPKGGGGSKFMKGLGAVALATTTGSTGSTMLRVEPVDDKMHAAVEKFLKDNKVADYMVAKWYNYNPDGNPKFDESIILERGLENASGADLAKAKNDASFSAQLSAQGFELIDNTFVVATNLRFRNNKALAKEIGDMAGGATGAILNNSPLGGLASLGAKKVAQAATNKLMKDMFSVTAVTNLYKLDWDESIGETLGEKVLYNSEATIDDLLKAGLCKLTYVGQTKARSGVKKDKNKTLDELTATATARAIDKALAKLQVENEIFRTTVPVSKSENGFVYAKIGTKEGVAPGDEYEILEQRMDEKAKKIVYKKVGSAKVEKDGVWFNTTGGEELIANADGKEAEQMKQAAGLGYTKFKTGKNTDFSGYYLRLSKKKEKIKD